MSETNDLLSEIQLAEGCLYLSDLYTNRLVLSESAKLRILEIPLNRYSLQEWNEAVYYITGKNCNCQSIEDARAKIAAGN